MTFSIVANDRDAGYCGSAVASRSIAVGGNVTYSRVGVGVINTQHYAHLALGHRVLDEMENGEAPHEALAKVLQSDGSADARQLIAIDVTGRQAAAISVTPHRDSRSTAVSIDLRVDDHVSPIEELGRLHDLFRREFGE
jgi:uncharacterized Ntn-hydrolase superfamily protein